MAACGSFDAEAPAAPAADAGEGRDGEGRDGEGPPLDAAPDGGASGYASVVLADGPILYLPLDEPAGAQQVRSLVDGRSVLLGAGVTLGVAGAHGTALRMDGSSAVALGAGPNTEGVRPFTYEAWARNLAAPDADWKMLFNREHQAGGRQTDIQNVYTRATILGFERYINEADVHVEAPLPASLWVHVATVYDGTQLQIFLSGSLVARVSDARATPAIQEALYLGYGLDPTRSFIGDVDEVAVYDKALAPERILAHASLARP